MMREFQERMKIIANSPVRVYLASYVPRYWYPYRLQHAGEVTTWVREESLEVIIDSAIGDDDIGNAETLARAHEVNADYVIPADVLHNQTATTDSVHEFVELYAEHDCRATPLIPLQPPYHEPYRELSEFSHSVLGGMATARPEEQLAGIRRFREEAGYGVYAHGLGLGASLTLIRAFRDEPRLLDSLDLSTPEQVVRSDSLADKTFQQTEFAFPRGENSSTVRANYAQAMALQLNYMLGPFCSDELLTDQYEQTVLGTVSDDD